MNESEGIHPPDWERFGIHPPSAFHPVGDPTRWGAQVVTSLDDDPAHAGRFTTPQILQAVTRDGYSRPWSMLGTLALPPSTWDTATIVVQLDFTMGVGQVQISQSILLQYFLGTDHHGLCVDQHFSAGGPYTPSIEASPTGNLQVRSFAIIGGLIGQTMSVRAVYNVAGPGPTPGFPTPSRLAMLVTPYAAGEGL